MVASPVVESKGLGWRRCEGALLLAFLLLAFVYCGVVQPGYGPDEPRHFRYVQRLAEKGALPLRQGNVEVDGAHTLHPPLYYALLVPAYLATHTAGPLVAARSLKLLSPVMLAAALWVFLGILRRCLPERPLARAIALGMVAFLPEFLLEASVINNDALAILLGALWLAVCVQAALGDRQGRCAAWIAGAILVAFVNTKATGWTLAPLWGVALVLRDGRRGLRTAAWWREVAIVYGLALALGTPWYLRNYALYGQPVPLDFGPGDALRPHTLPERRPLSPLEVYTGGWVVYWGMRAAVGLFQSFWVQIDWVPEEARPICFGLLAAWCGLALIGWIGRALRRREPLARGERVLAALAGGGLALVAAHTWYVATFLHIGFYQGGRYLMPAAFGAGVLLALGWEGLLPTRWRGRAAPWVLAAVAVGWVAFHALCLDQLIHVLNPTYVDPLGHPALRG